MDEHGGCMGTSIPPDPRWSAQTSKAEKALWRWAVDQLDDRVLVLPQVAITLREKGRPDEAEIDLLPIDPEGGTVIVEVKGGRIRRRREAGRLTQRRRGRRDRHPRPRRAGQTRTQHAASTARQARSGFR
jgi:hypothetical protein